MAGCRIVLPSGSNEGARHAPESGAGQLHGTLISPIPALPVPDATYWAVLSPSNVIVSASVSPPVPGVVDRAAVRRTHPGALLVASHPGGPGRLAHDGGPVAGHRQVSFHSVVNWPLQVMASSLAEP